MSRNVESSIQRAVVDWIKKTYPMVMIQATLNEHSRGAMSMGCTKGITDLLLFYTPSGQPMHVIFLELKTKAGRLSVSQTEWVRDWYNEKLKADNTHHAVAYGFSEAKAEISAILKNVVFCVDTVDKVV